MRDVDLTIPAGQAADPRRLARLTRHLNARLLDFGPGGPEVLSADQERGLIRARFPGHDTAQTLDALHQTCGVRAALDGDAALFSLGGPVSFEDLDYVWGCLFDILT